MAELLFAPKSEFDRVLASTDKLGRVRAFSALARLNTMSMIKQAGSGHIGTSFSCLELVSWIHLEGMRRCDNPADGFRDIAFSSKGHDAPALYAVLTGLGLLDFDLVHKLRRIDGLPGHPDVSTPHVLTNTGSLGMGISKARGMLHAARLDGRDDHAFVVTGDGELQEGQFWESLQPTVNLGVSDITVVIDHNKIQSDTWVERVSDLGDLERKLESYGWRVSRIDGHDVTAIDAALSVRDDRPHIVIADTIKGHGVSFMQSTEFPDDGKFYGYHSGAPSDEDYAAGLEELLATANDALSAIGLDELSVKRVPMPSKVAPPPTAQKLVGAYGRALVEQATKNKDIVALDADLVLDTGLTEFVERFPDRFIECGIAEMDMVSQAGGLALRGKLPVVHSFACFLSTRPNEQIYNNATERTKIVYAGSLAGVVPGGPGHSHQCVRDIAALSGTPGFFLVEPATEAEVTKVVDFCLNRTEESSYIRLVSIPCDVPFSVQDVPLVEGQGSAIRDGADAILFSYGPVALSEAWRAAEKLDAMGVALRIVNQPWLDRVDNEWLAKEVGGYSKIVTVDNHYIEGGQGNMLAAAIASFGEKKQVHRIGLTEIPACGTNDEVLKHHRLDAESLVEDIFAFVRS